MRSLLTESGNPSRKAVKNEDDILAAIWKQRVCAGCAASRRWFPSSCLEMQEGMKPGNADYGVNTNAHLLYKTVIVMSILIGDDSRRRTYALARRKIQSPVSPSLCLRQRIEKGLHWYNRWTRTETWRGGRRDEVEGSGEQWTCPAHVPAYCLPVSAALPPFPAHAYSRLREWPAVELDL